MVLNKYAIGERIYSARRRNRLTQSDLAEMAGISNTYLSHIENGSKCMSMETFVEIVNALGVSADELLVDNIKPFRMITGEDISNIVNGCSNFEQKMILDMATALKAAIRNNRED